MKDWMIWAGLVVLIVWALISAARKERRERLEAAAAYQAQNEAELEREANFALLVRDQSRYARNYAKDMVDTGT